MKEVHILLVEDNDGDIILTQEALYDAKVTNRLSVVRDGEEAINFLDHAVARQQSNMPDLILLDINLPKIDGKEVLFYIKNNSDLKKIPVVMLSTSSSEIDISDAYGNHANCFITKPVDLTKFFGVIRTIESFWTTIVKLPSKD